MPSPETTFKIQAYSKKQLREWYGVSCKTFKTWLKAIPDLGLYEGKAYTPNQVAKIVTHLGQP
jgi:transposase